MPVTSSVWYDRWRKSIQIRVRGKSVLLAQSHFNQCKKSFDEQDWLQFFYNLNFPENFACPSGNLKTEFTNPVAKSTSPGLLDTTFFARWFGCVERIVYTTKPGGCKFDLAQSILFRLRISLKISGDLTKPGRSIRVASQSAEYRLPWIKPPRQNNSNILSWCAGLIITFALTLY